MREKRNALCDGDGDGLVCFKIASNLLVSINNYMGFEKTLVKKIITMCLYL